VQTGDYDVIHFAGHAWYQGSEATLHFWDGTVSSSELASILKRRPPTLLVLNSHVTAFVPCGAQPGTRADFMASGPPGVDRPLPPPLGFMGLASRSGVGAFVGTFAGAVQDESACEFAVEFYRCMANGQRFSDALLSARKMTTNIKDTTGLVYAGSGDPDVVIAEAPLR
jgi:CHAT domain-containing protein